MNPLKFPAQASAKIKVVRIQKGPYLKVYNFPLFIYKSGLPPNLSKNVLFLGSSEQKSLSLTSLLVTSKNG